MDPVPTVFLVDHDPDTRESLRLLARSIGLVVHTFANARAFLKAITPHRPGCVVLDVRMRGMTLPELQEQLAAREVYIPMIMTAGHADVPMAVNAMKAGAFDFVEKPFRGQRILDAIERAVAQDRRARASREQGDDIRARLARLTRRERQVLKLVAAGMTSGVIASELGLQSKTVEVYRSHINKKMKARNVADLVRLLHSVAETGTNPSPVHGRERDNDRRMETECAGRQAGLSH